MISEYFKDMPVSIDWRRDGSLVYKGFIQKKLRKNFRVRIPKTLNTHWYYRGETASVPGEYMKPISLEEMKIEESKPKKEPFVVNKTVNVFVNDDGGLKETSFKSKRKRGDCVVRALSIGLKKPYTEIFNSLCDLAKETGFFPNDDDTYGPYLKQNGWIKNKPQRVNGHLKSLENFNSKGITAIVIVRGHLVCVSDGKIYDSWDCKFYCAHSYWPKGKKHQHNDR